MARPRYLHQRAGGGWQYRRRWPKEVRSVAPGDDFTKGLGTPDRSVAIRRRPAAEDEFWSRVDHFKRQLEDRPGARPRVLSEAEASTIVSRWFRRMDKEADELHLSNPVPPAVREETLRDHAAVISQVDEALATNNTEAVAPLAEFVLAEEGIVARPEGPGYRTLLQLLWRGNKELALKDRARLQGEFGHRPSDPFFATALEQGDDGRPKRTLGELIDAHWAAKANGWSARTREQFPPVHRLLKDALGAERNVTTIGIEEAELIERLVRALPANLSKRKELQGLAVPEAVERGQELGLPTIAPKTINGTYVNGIRSIFKWAEEKHWLDRNPMRAIDGVNDPVHASKKRDPFTIEQLKQLFAEPPWSGPGAGPGKHPGRYWAPILALYHGFRRAEVCGLKADEIQEREGCPVIIVTPNDARGLKNAEAERVLPVHPEVIRLGFLEYARKRREGGQEMLFPDARTKSRGQMGHNIGEWFNPLVKSLGLKGRLLTFHALRHTFKDRLREAAVSREIADALTGHHTPGVSSTYGSGFSTGRLRGAIEKVKYPGLDLLAAQD